MSSASAHRDYRLPESPPEEWLRIEWPKGEKEPTKNCLSRHNYLELKQQVGLGDFEGRGWRGFHHHATMSIVVYGFLISERGAFPSSGPVAKALFRQFALPKGYRPRGAAAAA